MSQPSETNKSALPQVVGGAFRPIPPLLQAGYTQPEDRKPTASTSLLGLRGLLDELYLSCPEERPSPDQQAVVDAIARDIERAHLDNTLVETRLSGKAGTGKTWVTRRLIALINELPKRIQARIDALMTAEEATPAPEIDPFERAQFIYNALRFQKMPADMVDKLAKMLSMADPKQGGHPVERARFLEAVVRKLEMQAGFDGASQKFETRTASKQPRPEAVSPEVFRLRARLRTSKNWSILLMAPTGRAARRLKDKSGHPTRTFHGAVYGMPVEEYVPTAVRLAYTVQDRQDPPSDWPLDILEAIKTIRAQVDQLTPPPTIAHLTDYFTRFLTTRELTITNGKKGESRKALNFGPPQPPCEAFTLIIIDEASMITPRQRADLLKVVPHPAVIIWVGDHRQLPPILEADPEAAGLLPIDLKLAENQLTTLHRQAESNPIVRVANRICEEKMFFGNACRPADAPQVRLIQGGSVEQAASWMAENVQLRRDAVLVTHKNDTRSRLNQLVRERLGFHSAAPMIGERIYIRENKWEFDLLNGQVVTLTDIQTRTFDVTKRGLTYIFYWMELTDEFGDVTNFYVPVEMFGKDLGAMRQWVKSNRYNLKNLPSPRGGVDDLQDADEGFRSFFLACDFGYALTCHAMQGSEVKHVGIFWDSYWMQKKDPETAHSWQYTALTRAQETATIWQP